MLEKAAKPETLNIAKTIAFSEARTAIDHPHNPRGEHFASTGMPVMLTREGVIGVANQWNLRRRSAANRSRETLSIDKSRKS